MFSRRVFMKAGGIALFSLGAGPKFLTRTALAAPGPGPAQRRKVLVTIFQRGAMDGLAAVPPVDATTFQGLRPRLALSAVSRRGAAVAAAPAATGGAGLIDLGVGFGLHPAL